MSALELLTWFFLDVSLGGAMFYLGSVWNRRRVARLVSDLRSEHFKVDAEDFTVRTAQQATAARAGKVLWYRLEGFLG